MDNLIQRLRGQRPSASYEPVAGDSGYSSLSNSITSHDSFDRSSRRRSRRFSWTEYGIFTLLGVAMLWAWSMFLAAAPYFESRFAGSEWLMTHFQSGILTVSTITNLCCTWLLTKLQPNANYPKRIVVALLINIVCFTMLAISTAFTSVEPSSYFGFLIAMVFGSSIATSFMQNGLFAFSSGFGVSDYTQGIMAGQGIAGVLPCIVQIVAVLSVPEVSASDDGGEPVAQEDPRSAFAYFMTATGVSALTLLAFFYLAVKNPRTDAIRDIAAETAALDEEDEEEDGEQELRGVRKTVGMWTLLKKLRWFACAVSVTFCVTMVYPVFAQEIVSVQDPATAGRLYQPAVFIPIGFLVWNTGDLIGRLLPLWPRLNGVRSPRFVFFGSLARLVFVPLYLMCNIKGRGAVIESDAFYLGVVQLWFGVTNGYFGSICMMAAPFWVDESEREAAGGFMGLMLVFGLSVGSLLSFLAAQA